MSDYVECPYCGYYKDVTDAEIYDDEVEIQCDKCKKEFICHGEQDYSYHSKPKQDVNVATGEGGKDDN